MPTGVPIDVRSVRQVALRATDLDRSVAFFTEVLGLALIARFDPPGLAFLQVGGVRLLLEGNAPASMLYLDVADIDEAWRALVGQGAELVGEPHRIFADDDGTFGPAGEEEWMAFFRDPDGNVIGLVSRRRPA